MFTVEELVKSSLRRMGYKADRYFEKDLCLTDDGYKFTTSPFMKIKDEIAPTIDMSDFSYKSNLTEKDFTWDYDEYWTDRDDKMYCSYRLPTAQEKKEIVATENRRREDEMYNNEYNHRLAKAIVTRITSAIQEAEKQWQREWEEWKRTHPIGNNVEDEDWDDIF